MKKLIKENEKVFLGDDFIEDIMSINIKGFWMFLSGKKTYLAMTLLFVYGGLDYLGYEFVWLKDVALWLGGIGLANKAYREFKK